MENNLELPRTGGTIEVYGASAHITEQLANNFVKRGNMAAQLVELTLRETPYTPTINGTTFEIEVSNIYKGHGPDEADTKDTVLVAQEALGEFLSVRVPGSRRAHLEVYGTYYGRMLRRLTPGFRDSKVSRDAFEESLVESSRSRGIQIASPEQAKEIIHGAPRTLRAFRLSDNRGRTNSSHQAVTENGRIIQVNSKVGLLLELPTYYLSRDIKNRQAIAPGSRIAHEIRERATHVRTRHSRR